MRGRLLLLPLFFCAVSFAPDMNACLMMQNQGSHVAGVNTRGDTAMGFSHEKTGHHFRAPQRQRLIEVDAKGPADVQSREQVRIHLTQFAHRFSSGDFGLPMFIHSRVPPGVPVIKKLGSEITYRYEPTERGGIVRIRGTNEEAIRSIHEFLKFQIADHRTGDSAQIQTR